jgi:hypothetical protein
VAARIAAVEAEATQVHEEVKRKEAQGRQHRRRLQAEASFQQGDVSCGPYIPP